MSAGICNSPKTTKLKNKLYRNSRLPEITTSLHYWLSRNVPHAEAEIHRPRPRTIIRARLGRHVYTTCAANSSPARANCAKTTSRGLRRFPQGCEFRPPPLVDGERSPFFRSFRKWRQEEKNFDRDNGRAVLALSSAASAAVTCDSDGNCVAMTPHSAPPSAPPPAPAPTVVYVPPIHPSATTEVDELVQGDRACVLPGAYGPWLKRLHGTGRSQ
jgi:hypothetical protein